MRDFKIDAKVQRRYDDREFMRACPPEVASRFARNAGIFNVSLRSPENFAGVV